MSTSRKEVSAEHVQGAVDTVLGVDPSQAPTDPVALGDRLSIPQPGMTEAISFLLSHQQVKHAQRALPLVYVVIESANRAFPEDMKAELKTKPFMSALASVAGESLAAAKGTGAVDGTTRERQPALAAWAEQQLGQEGGFAKKLSIDDRAGVYALVLGTIRAVDKHLLGPETPVHVKKEPGRNNPCFCASGKKYKKCHGAPGATAN